MDPQQRLVLEHGYESIHASGCTRCDLLGSATGMYLGILSTEFALASTAASAHKMTGVGNCFTSGRLSYVLGLQGACVAFDVGCSSSLVAAWTGARSLQMGECSASVVSGVHTVLMPMLSLTWASGAITSLDGQCKTFDSRADGFGRGEGSCCVCVHSITTRARGRVDRENKVSKEARQLAYLVYGKFRFDGRDKKGVFRFGTEWVSVEQMAEHNNWGEKEDEFDRRVRAMRAPYAGSGDDESSSSSSSSSDDDDDDD